MKKNILLSLLVILLSINVFAYDFSAVCETGQTLYYEIFDAQHHYVRIVSPNLKGWSGFEAPSGEMVIPSVVSYQGTEYVVREIGGHAFRQTAVESVVFCDSLRVIGDHAFYNSQLTGELVIPDFVDSIAPGAFVLCSKITSLCLGNSVRYIGNRAFNCAKLRGTVTIPESVVTIESEAFWQSKIDTVIFNATNCQTMGDYYFPAFDECNSLKVLVIGENVRRIPDRAFKDCASLNCELHLPDSITEIGYEAFFGCYNLAGQLILPSNLVSIGSSAFEYCYKLSGNLAIPDKVESIGSDAFYRCENITSVSVPKSVTSFGTYVFYDCNALDSVFYDAVYCTCSDELFRECRNLRTIVIGEDVRFYYGTFGGYSSMDINTVYFNAIECSTLGGGENLFIYAPDQLVIGEKVKIIPDRAFRGFHMTELHIPESVVSIGKNSFEYCSGLTDLVIPNSVRTVGEMAFDECSSLRSVVIGNSVEAINSATFSGCSNLRNVVIGANVNSIAANAFSGCHSILELTSKSAIPPYMSDMAFQVSNAITVNVPCGAVETYRNTDVWKTFINYVGIMPELTVASSDVTKGSAEIVKMPTCEDKTAIVKAIPNAGFSFTGWLLNGIVVSSNAEYSFEIEEDANLVAMFGYTDVSENDSECVKVYPNPVHDMLTIKGVNVCSAELIDVVGKVLCSQYISESGCSFDVSSVVPGIYFVKIVEGNGCVSVVKIVKE